MLATSELAIMGVLGAISVVLIFLLNYLQKQKNKTQLYTIFSIIFVILIFWMVCLISQIYCVKKFSAKPIYFDYFVYISICFLPIAFLFMSLIFSRTKISFKKVYMLLFIIPSVSLILLWTNNLHHLFYKEYSTNYAETVFGPYLYVHSIYTYALYLISLFILVKYTIKNSGFFSRQACLILFGALVPIVTNALATFSILPMSIYITPITFAVAVIFFTFGIFKFDLLKATPIALQRIVDRISDSYIILNENYYISDFNQTFITTFGMESSNLRGTKVESFLKEIGLDIADFEGHIEKIRNNDKTESFELYIEKVDKYFNVEITSIVVNEQFLGILVLFKDITQHVSDMKQVQNAQESMMESERLSSLGQLIGGIAHNLKTPIMSISGATEGLRELIDEYDKSIESPEVTSGDHHEIAKDMNEWVVKIRNYTEYMSDIITAVRGQAVTLSATENVSFNIDDLVKRVNILMNHELKSAQINMVVDLHDEESLEIQGDINSLVQVVNNMISNAIQSYNGKAGEEIKLDIHRQDDNIIISVKDHGCGLSDNVKEKLFKEMITTKGKNGTGLGMYMSYSTIKANFGGNITFQSEKGRGTTFSITIPLMENRGA